MDYGPERTVIRNGAGIDEAAVQQLYSSPNNCLVALLRGRFQADRRRSVRWSVHLAGVLYQVL